MENFKSIGELLHSLVVEGYLDEAGPCLSSGWGAGARDASAKQLRASAERSATIGDAVIKALAETVVEDKPLSWWHCYHTSLALELRLYQTLLNDVASGSSPEKLEELQWLNTQIEATKAEIGRVVGLLAPDAGEPAE